MTVVAAVIPYYQRTPGILARAIASVLRQEVDEAVQLRIIVVDDESPCPPDAEIASLPDMGRHEIVVLRQANGGPGAARNRALDYLTDHPVDFVALLDSDDEWEERHVARALTLLGDGRDHFFEDHTRGTHVQASNYFGESPTIVAWLGDIEHSPFESIGDHAYAFRRSTPLRPFLEDYLSQTSTVVYRHAPLKHLRFDPSLRTAGEDLLFWFELAHHARGSCFSTSVGAHCGQGVNIFHGAQTWDAPTAPARFAYQLVLWRTVADRYPLAPAERVIVEEKIAGFQRGFAYIWLRALLKHRRLNAHLLSMLRTRVGWSPLSIVPQVGQVLRRRMLGQALFPEQ